MDVIEWNLRTMDSLSVVQRLGVPVVGSVQYQRFHCIQWQPHVIGAKTTYCEGSLGSRPL